VLAAAADQTIRDYSTDAEHTVYINRQPFAYRNTNLLVQNPAWRVDIQKTGYISKAGRCLVMQAVIEGKRVVMVLLDSVGKYSRIADAQRIRDWLETSGALNRPPARSAESSASDAARPI